MIYRLLHLLDRWGGVPLCALAGVLHRRRPPVPGADRRNILLIKFSMMGDTVLLIPALRAVRRAYPAARITVLCSPVNEAVVRACPYVDTVVRCEIVSLAMPWYAFRLLAALRRGKFDIAIDFEQWFRFSAIITFFSGARWSIGFRTAGQHRHGPFDAAVPHEDDRHEIDCFGDLLRAADIPFTDASLEFRIPDAAASAATGTLAAAGIPAGVPYAVIHPGSSHWPQKQWSVAGYAAVCGWLARERELPVVITGSADETALARSIADRSGAPGIHVVAGTMSLHELAAVLRAAELVVCGNTGVLHLACAVGAPVVLINGPVSADKWGPRGRADRIVATTAPCAPCVRLGFEYRCAGAACMGSIRPEEVINACSLSLMRHAVR